MTRTAELPHHLERTVLIQAERESVFRFFTDSRRWATWWGAGSSIDARPGGRVFIRFPDGTEASGEVIDIQAPERIVFTYGFVSGKPIPAGSSLVTVRLEAQKAATRLSLSHAFTEPVVRDEHVQGWRYQLSLFANVVADEVHAGATETVDAWFAVWSEPDATRREATLAQLVASDVHFRDRFSLVEGLTDLLPHLTAIHRFMPGIRIQREGDIRHCQGTVLADWVARTSDGGERGRGTNVFVFCGGNQIESVMGFWNVTRQT